MRQISVALIVSIFFIGSVLAHGAAYFEFNPDYFRSYSLKLNSGEPVYEIFLPQNEFLGGFDFWFDNTGSTATINFELQNSSGQTLSSKTMSVDNTGPIAGGQRFHEDLNSQLTVVGNQQYRIKILTNSPSVKIYYSDRVKFLAHNAAFSSEYVNGVAEVSGEEQNFSFKFALYESSENSPPIITNLGIFILSPDQISLKFNANEPIDYKIDYGISGQGLNQHVNFNNDFEFCGEGVLLCEVLLPTISGNDYEYMLTAKDSWNNQTQVSGSFTSGSSVQTSILPTPTQSLVPTATPTPQTSGPTIISNVRILNIKDKSADIAWTTNKAANSNLIVSFSSAFITIAAYSDSTLELEHLLSAVDSLQPGTSYFATITSRDSYNNEAVATASFSTMPLTQIPSPAPQPSSQPQPSSNPTSTSTISTALSQEIITTTEISNENGEEVTSINWNIPEDGEPENGYRIDIFDDENNLEKSINVAPGVHQAEVSALSKGQYSVVVYSNNDGVYKKVAKPKVFKTGTETLVEKLSSLLPVLLGVLSILIFFAWKIFFKKKPAS